MYRNLNLVLNFGDFSEAKYTRKGPNSIALGFAQGGLLGRCNVPAYYQIVGIRPLIFPKRGSLYLCSPNILLSVYVFFLKGFLILMQQKWQLIHCP